MSYEPFLWRDGEAGETPITAERLNHIEQGIASTDRALSSIQELLSPPSVGTYTLRSVNGQLVWQLEDSSSPVEV